MKKMRMFKVVCFTVLIFSIDSADALEWSQSEANTVPLRYTGIMDYVTIPYLTAEEQLALELFKSTLTTVTPSFFTLMEYQTRSKSQGFRGTCTAFSFIAAVEAAYIRKYGMHSENTNSDGFLKWQEYDNIQSGGGITNDCSLVSSLCPTCRCEEFDLSEEYLINVAHSTQSVHTTTVNYDSFPSDCATADPQFWPPTPPDIFDGFKTFVAGGLTLPREEFAPYFGGINANLNAYGTTHYVRDYQGIAISHGIAQIDTNGDYVCTETRTQKQIDDFNFDTRIVPHDARRNAFYGVENLIFLDDTSCQNTADLEVYLANNHEIMFATVVTPLDCAQPLQMHADGHFICKYDSTADHTVGHGMLIVGYDHTDPANPLFLLKDSRLNMFMWVPYAYIQDTCVGAHIINGVRDPKQGRDMEAMWIGKWSIDHDGHRGNLVIRRTRKMPDENTPFAFGAPGLSDSTFGTVGRLGTYYDSNGAAHKVTGQRGYVIPHLHLNIDFDNIEGPPDSLETTITLEGQPFDLEIFYNPENEFTFGNFAAGKTAWNGTFYGTLLSKSELPELPDSFTTDSWKRKFKVFQNQTPHARYLEISEIEQASSEIWRKVYGQYGTDTGYIGSIETVAPHHLLIPYNPVPDKDLYHHTWEEGITSGLGIFALSCDVPFNGVPSLCNPPVAVSDDQFTFECQREQITTSLDARNSYDPDGDAITYSWSTNCSNGEFEALNSSMPIFTFDPSNGCNETCNVLLKVTDVTGEWSSASTMLAVDDTADPIITCPADTTIECDQSTDTANTGNAFSTDVCDPIPAVGVTATSITIGSCFEESTITRTWTAIDSCGNSAGCNQTINVVDTTPPVISLVSASPDVLWPPNHKMTPVVVAVDASDKCGPKPVCKIILVESNEPDNAVGDTAPDWEITGALTVNLRAERSGNGNSRFYRVTVDCMDDCGNSATTNAMVTVPHNKVKIKKK